MVEAIKLDTIWQAILVVAGAIVALYGAGSAVAKLFSPYKKIAKKVDEHDRRLAAGDARFHRDEQTDTAIIKALFALLEHARTNNSTGLIAEASKELQQHLVERK